MGTLTRFTISLETELLDRFMRLAKKHAWGNRSEAIRTVMREALVREEWQGNTEIVGTITMVYDHHKRELSEKLMSIQHDHHDAILAVTHIHLDHDNCLEMLAVKGTASSVQRIADTLLSTKGVKHGKLVATTTGKKLG